MIYQVVTRNGLCRSKKYFTSKQEIVPHIKSVIEATENYYPVEFRHMEEGVSVIEIDTDSIKDWQTLFGPEKEISPPYKPEKPGKKHEISI